MTTISFQTKLYNIGSRMIAQLPNSVSKKLPSRGMVMVKGTINGFAFLFPLEPDGKGSHWIEVPTAMLNSSKFAPGKTARIEIESIKEWIEPKVPRDIQNVFTSNPKAYQIWKGITAMARWDWIRWINGTKESKTRQRRIATAISKLKSGIRRPCCFDRTKCTDPFVSNKGVLIV